MNQTSAHRSPAIHYWTGRGTLCSLDNSVEKKQTHTSYKADVSCPYCLHQLRLKSPPMNLCSAGACPDHHYRAGGYCPYCKEPLHSQHTEPTK